MLDYFQKSRDILLRIRRNGGLPAGGVPDDWIAEPPSRSTPAGGSIADDQLEHFLQRPSEPSHHRMLRRRSRRWIGFRMELVAAEPIVQSPVAAAFDADGHLYVAEMRDYPYKPRAGRRRWAPCGCCATPTATAGSTRARLRRRPALGGRHCAVEGGRVRRRAAGHLVLKDTDGDFRADVRDEGLHGIRHAESAGDGEQPGLGPRSLHLRRGVGEWRDDPSRRDDPEAPGVSVEHSDFRFDPVSGAFEPSRARTSSATRSMTGATGSLCNESHPLSQPVLPRRELARNPYLPVPRRSGTSPGARCRSSGSARSSAGGRSVRADGSPMASGRPDRRE